MKELTKAQQEYFKNSITRDESGDLKTFYHGSRAVFDEFSLDYMNSGAGAGGGRGFYFSSDKELVDMMYAKGTNTLEVYLNVKNSVRNDSVMSFEQFQKIMSEAEKYYDLKLSETYLERMASKEDLTGMDCYCVFEDITEELVKTNENIKDAIEEYLEYYTGDIKDFQDNRGIIEEYGDYDNYLVDADGCTLDWDDVVDLYTTDAENEIFIHFMKMAGYDAIDHNCELIVFNPNQIKMIDNLYPTNSDNFRDNSEEYLQQNRSNLTLPEQKEIAKHIKERSKQERSCNKNKQREAER